VSFDEITTKLAGYATNAALGAVPGAVIGGAVAGPENRVEGALAGGATGALFGLGGTAWLRDSLKGHDDVARATRARLFDAHDARPQPPRGLTPREYKDDFVAANARLAKGIDASDAAHDAAVRASKREIAGVTTLGGVGASAGAGALVDHLSPDESASKIASSPALTSIVRLFRKEADLRTSLMRALGGAAVGGAVGGGGGALMAHLQGGDVAANARKGAIGGAGLGMMGGALSGFAPRGTLAGMPADALTKGTGAALTGLGGAFGAHLMSPISGGGGAAAEQAQRELGKFNGQQAIKQQQSAALAPQHDQAFHQAQQDEVIQQADPSLVASSFSTMKRFAPNLAADPNAVRSFLRESATWNSGPSYATLKNLADAERAVAGAGGAGSTF